MPTSIGSSSRRNGSRLPRIRLCRRVRTSQPSMARRTSTRSCGSSIAARICRRGWRSIPRAWRCSRSACRTSRRGSRRRATWATSFAGSMRRRRRAASCPGSSRNAPTACRCRNGGHRATRRPPGHRLSRRRRCGAVLQGRRHRKSVEERLLRERIADALPLIEERVCGQRPAVTKTIDILMRSMA